MRTSLARITLIGALLFVCGAKAQSTEAPVLRWQQLQLGAAGARYVFPVYANGDLDGDLSHVERVLLIQHGRARDGDKYFHAAEMMMRRLDIAPLRTLLISPQFFAPEQAGQGRPGDLPTWGRSGFAGGEDSQSPPASVSSFEVYDDLLLMLADRKRLPALSKIVLAGHSGGAVLVQQFAVLNHIDETVRVAGIDIRYVVANASAFLYFNNWRPSGDGFALYDPANCPGYNDHRYGFDKIVRYAVDGTPTQMFRRYMARKVVYLFGSLDVDSNHSALDKSCAAQAQGSNRLERGRGYLRHEQALAAAEGVVGAHRSFEVVGVGHDQEAMLSSACGARIIFDAPAANRSNAAECVETTIARPG